MKQFGIRYFIGLLLYIFVNTTHDSITIVSTLAIFFISQRCINSQCDWYQTTDSVISQYQLLISHYHLFISHYQLLISHYQRMICWSHGADDDQNEKKSLPPPVIQYMCNCACMWNGKPEELGGTMIWKWSVYKLG